MNQILLISPAQPKTAMSPRHLVSRGMIDLVSWLARNEVEADYLDLELEGRSCLHLPSAGTVGIGANSFTYPDVVTLAAQAQERGLPVILGGTHITAIHRQVRIHQPYALVRGDGEIPLLKWLRGEPIVASFYPKPDFEVDWPMVLRLFKWEKYFQRQQQSLPSPPYGKRTWIIESRSGCPWRLKGRHPDFMPRPGDPRGYCIFCSTSKNRVYCRPPEAIWQEIQTAISYLGIDSILDWSDSLTGSWLRELLEARPKELAGRLSWQFYFNAEEVEPTILPVLTELGVTRIFIGMESGDSQVLKNLRKRVSPEENLRAFDLLTDVGVEPECNFVLGAPGETRQSLENTVRFVEHLATIYVKKTGKDKMVWSSGSILMPLPGSPIYQQVMRTQEGAAWKDSDLSGPDDLFRLREIYLRNFCPQISMKDLEWATSEISQYSILHNEFGRLEQ